jgi:hypothetical protein
MHMKYFIRSILNYIKYFVVARCNIRDNIQESSKNKFCIDLIMKLLLKNKISSNVRCIKNIVL